jgi:hypothetical protein
MFYVKEIIEHKIGDRTPFKNVADQMGWTLTIDEANTEVAYDGSLWEKGYAPEKPAPTHEEISALREQAYISEIDTLHAQRQRKTILGTWTEEDEAEYIAQVKARSEDIANRYPYPVEE